MEICLPLLNTSYKTSAKISEFAFITFVFLSYSWYALELLRFKISFLISGFEKGWHENYFPLNLALIAKIIGWSLYCSITRRTGYSICSKFTGGSSYCVIFKFETTLVKKSLNVSAISSFWSSFKSFLTNVIFLKLGPLSVKWAFVYFQKNLLWKTF